MYFLCSIIFSTTVLVVFGSSIYPNSEQYWGPEKFESNNVTGIQPFTVNFTDEMIKDLRYRLRNHRPFTPPLEGVGFEYGFNTDALDSWATYWAEEYNFTEREEYLNKYPQYTVTVQGLPIHFLWVKPENCSSDVEVLPLLLLHGWPGSVREFYATIESLTNCSSSRNFAVQVIAPSLPGFGFSGAAVRPGMGGSEIAVVIRNLMKILGFEKYLVQGGDWGAYVGMSLATMYPDEVLMFHTNFAFSITPKSLGLYALGSLFPSLVVSSETADRMYPISTILYYMVRELGYLHLQSSKPDSLGVAMADSPIGLLAYTFQIMSGASRSSNYYTKDGGFDALYTRDELLDNIMFYWSTNSFTTATRIYAETFNLRNYNLGIFSTPTAVPTCTVHAKDESFYQSPALLKYKFTNLVNVTVLDNYGHFLAMEQPVLFADNVLDCIESVLTTN